MTRRGRRVGSLKADELATAIAEGVDRAYLGGSGIASELEALLSSWRIEAEGMFEAWDCDSDRCPGLPAWQRELRAVLWDAPDGNLLQHVEGAVRAWFMQRLLAFAAAHPEARLAPTA
ncbi:MAG: hypothetical protein U0869_25435 [Chloroflexota bacterium]